MDFLLTNINYVHVMAMTILLSYLAMAVRRLDEKAIKWNLLLILCLASYIVRVLFVEVESIYFYFFNTIEYLTPVLFMLAIQFNFDDDFEIGKVEWGVIALLLCFLIIFLVGRILGSDFKDSAVRVHLTFQYGLVAFCVLWAYWRTIQTWSNDLMELRRKLRLFFVILVGPAILAGVVLYYVSIFNESWSPYVDLFVSSAIVFSGIFSFFAFGNITLQQLPLGIPSGQDSAGKNERVHVNPDYQQEIDALKTIMEVDKRYLESNLNMAKLADYARVPEYKIRVAINQVLGHKNFNSYLNAYRIEAAKSLLADPDNQEAITNIAMDCGYLNQSTFNKAFRESTQQTPSEYRDQARK